MRVLAVRTLPSTWHWQSRCGFCGVVAILIFFKDLETYADDEEMSRSLR